MERKKLSLAIITLNEEANIRRCIESASFADEVIVVDSGSKDRTIEIAMSLGAKCVHQDWLGYTAQKNKAAELCQYDWVLSLDADEALSDEAQKEVIEFLSSSRSDEFTGLQFPRKSFHLGQWINHGGWYPDYQLRLFNHRQCYWHGGALHESVLCHNYTRAKAPLLHWVFKDLSHQVETNNRYSSLGAEKLLQEGKAFRMHWMLLKPVSKFLETYLFKRGFLDGFAGFVISIGAAYSIFLKFAKLYYLEKNKEEKKN